MFDPGNILYHLFQECSINMTVGRFDKPTTLLFPKSLADKAILTFDNGQTVQLDRSLFQHVENPVKMFHVNNQPRIKTTIVNRDKTFKTGLKKKKRVVVRKAKPAAEGPLTQASAVND